MIIKPESCKDLTDNELVGRSLDNLDYFSCLYQRYEAELHRYIRRLARVDEEEAQDILQESFIKIWRKLNDFNNDLKLSSWIYRIVHNEAVSFLRSKKSYGKDKRSNVDNLREDIVYDDIAETETEALDNLAHDTLDRLPLKYREVLVLKFFGKKSYGEISDILKIPEGTVAIRINRAKKIFRDMADIQNMIESE